MSAKKQTLYLRVSGGVGGISIEGAIDVDALPPDLARRAMQVLAPDRLEQVARRSRAPYAADQLIYELAVPDEQRGEMRAFAIHESQADDELLEVLDALTTHMIAARMRTRKARERAEKDAANSLSTEPKGNSSLHNGRDY